MLEGVVAVALALGAVGKLKVRQDRLAVEGDALAAFYGVDAFHPLAVPVAPDHLSLVLEHLGRLLGAPDRSQRLRLSETRLGPERPVARLERRP
jgi:hypothetical protein